MKVVHGRRIRLRRAGVARQQRLFGEHWRRRAFVQETAGLVLPRQVGLLAEGADGLPRLVAAADALLTRPPEPVGVVEASTLPTLAPDAVEFVVDTDTPLTMCACSASSDEPY